MLEASAVATAIPSLWSAINSWFTPAVLFLLLNLMIATIALTSSLTTTHTHEHDQHGGPPSAPSAAEKSPPVSILDRLKSLGLLFPSSSSSPGKAPPQRQPSPLISPEELYAETHGSPEDPFEERGLGGTGSRSPVGKFEDFDLYGYLPGEEPASGIPRESGPAHYIFEPTQPQEVVLPPERDEKAEEGVEEEEAGKAEEEVDVVEEEEEEEETRVEDGSEEEEREAETGAEAELPRRLLRGGIRRSESLNVRFSFANVGEEGGRGPKEAGDVVVAELVERRRPATAREGKGKWVGAAGGDEEGEVDARADDFINKFKQQLKMQRMDSLAKLKDAAAMSKLKSI